MLSYSQSTLPGSEKLCSAAIYLMGFFQSPSISGAHDDPEAPGYFCSERGSRGRTLKGTHSCPASHKSKNKYPALTGR